MIVTCDIQACPYWEKNFCTKAVLKITQNGMCKHLTKQNWQAAVSPESKEPINMITLAKAEEKPEDKKEEDTNKKENDS